MLMIRMRRNIATDPSEIPVRMEFVRRTLPSKEKPMSGLTDIPGLSAAMVASIAAFQMAQQMAQASVALVASAGGGDARAALPYTRMLDKLV